MDGRRAKFDLEPVLEEEERSPCFVNLRDSAVELNSSSHPNTQINLTWVTPPKVCFLVGKFDKEVISKLIEVATWLQVEKGLDVVVENNVICEAENVNFIEVSKLDSLGRIDFGICIGGDGTVLHFNTFFPSHCPPVICFNFKASLGFLTKFSIDNYEEDLSKVINGPIVITLRSRIRVVHQRTVEYIKHKEFVNQKNEDIEDYNSFTCLNEVVLDRGPSPFLSCLDCYYDDHLITTVQGDGLIIATSTGSTAYSLSAGGSMLHPCVPAMIFTPISPHSLSFRPVILPSVAHLTIKIAPESRGNAWVCYDGRRRFEVKPNDQVMIKMSRYPMPTVSFSSEMGEWFSSLANCLSWNIRPRQGKE